MKALEIIRFLEKQYPLELQSKDDNSGLQIGSLERDVKRVAVAYEKTLDVISRCIKNRCDMLITHRPLFMPKRFGDPPKIWWDRFQKVIDRSDMIIYSVHENLDFGKDSTALCLSKTLRLKFEERKEQYMICKTKAMRFSDFVSRVENLLEPAYIIASGNAGASIRRIGLVAGTAMNLEDIAFFKSASVDCFLSGDPDDFGIRYARDLDLMTINVDDYSLERPAMIVLYNLLVRRFEKLKVEFIDCRYEQV